MKEGKLMPGQMSILDELIIDSFAGGGGASTGIELATGRIVNVAINHDPDAIKMHMTNHPYTEHYQASVWDLDPKELCKGQPVGLAWFSPDCKHFSKAKGSALVDKHIRGLAWIVLRWAGTVRPRVILLENVEEFQTWGPVRKGRPIKSKAGQTFKQWLKQLKDLGYEVEFKELVAADYGAPTSRKRFFMVARCDGKPIQWPKPTHGPVDSPEVESGKLKPWISAAEIIDWSLPCPSIFDSKQDIKNKYGISAMRPLKENTLRRIARGLDKFVIKSGKPFIVPRGYGEKQGQAPRVHDIGAPLPTLVGTGKHYVCAPSLIKYHSEQADYTRGQALERPIMTVDGSNRYGLTAASLVKYYSGADQAQTCNTPLHTITTKPREGITTAHLAEFKGQDKGQAVDRPLRTLTASIGCFGAVKTTIEKYTDKIDLQYWPEVRKLLNAYCGYSINDDEILLLWIDNTPYFIADIGLRMLSPRELYKAQGFPDDYIIDHDYQGNSYNKTAQVARCGNAVCPPIAKALVRANVPEWCNEIDISTMKSLLNHVAV